MDAISNATPQPAAMARGKSAMATGQLAKAAVSEAKTAGIEVPKNAQGVAASQIAKGADPASIFAATVIPDDPAQPDAPVEVETPLDTLDATTPEAPSPVKTDYEIAAVILDAKAQNSAQTALDLLS